MSERKNEMDRREFLKRGGILLATTAVAAGGVSSLTGCEAAYTTSYAAKTNLTYNFLKKVNDEAAPYPYPYQKLDPTTCAERAYFGYFKRGG